ncbi:MAG: hypothetical protein ABI162_08915 [Luteolibacter sp.]
MKRAIANRDPASVSRLFHMGSSNASEIVDYLKSSDSRDGPIESYRWLSSMDVDGLLLEGVSVTFKGIEKPVERLAFLTPDKDGIWKLDFDAFARSVKPSWEALLGKSVDQAVVRVIVGRDSYFNGLYRDETKWACYGLASPDINELLRGYCKVGSPEQTALESLLSDGVRMNRATLELRHVKESESRQFEITRILAKDWVIPNQPD